MVLSFVSLKGGSGKSTLSTNLAVSFANQGASVCLIDADPNNLNAIKWSGFRPEDRSAITVVALPDPAALRNNLKGLESSHDIVIIDGTPALEKLTGTIMLLSDLVLLPIRASDYDLWAFNDKFLPKLEDIRSLKPELDCRIVRNAANEDEIIEREVLEILNEYDLVTLDSVIGDRTIFKRTPRTGLGVTELADPQAKKAGLEIESLAKEVSEILTESKIEY